MPQGSVWYWKESIQTERNRKSPPWKPPSKPLQGFPPALHFLTAKHGGITHGPVPRSHEMSLPKKVRALGLKAALSAKLGEV